MNDSPVGKTYIGLAYNKTTATESNTATDYTWALIKGDQGIQGPDGEDGQSLYTWIKYADTPTTGMNDSPTGKKYLGIAYNKTSPTESTSYGDYSWSLIEGPQGPTRRRRSTRATRRRRSTRSSRWRRSTRSEGSRVSLSWRLL